MINPTIFNCAFFTLLTSAIFYLGYTIVKSLLIIQALKKFAVIIQNEMKTELMNQYAKLCQGDIEVQDFYEFQEWSGQLYSKIFEDYRNGLMKHYFKLSKGRTKVK